MLFAAARTLTACSLFATSLFGSYVFAGPTVVGNRISWTDDGWHQVQRQSTYESVCNGGRQCTVEAGVYTVINHGTGERFSDIAVPGIAADDDGAIAPVASTGQVNNYAFGDDGDFQLGLAIPGERFTDNGDGTFVDNLTGITWLGIRDCIVKRYWASGLEYANSLAANSSDCPSLDDGSEAGEWRVPNIKELYSLVDVSDNSPSWARGIPYSGTWSDFPWDYYWSSTSFEPVPEINAFAMDSGFGLIDSYTKDLNQFWIWPIRVE